MLQGPGLLRKRDRLSCHLISLICKGDLSPIVMFNYVEDSNRIQRNIIVNSSIVNGITQMFILTWESIGLVTLVW